MDLTGTGLFSSPPQGLGQNSQPPCNPCLPLTCFHLSKISSSDVPLSRLYNEVQSEMKQSTSRNTGSQPQSGQDRKGVGEMEVEGTLSLTPGRTLVTPTTGTWLLVAVLAASWSLHRCAPGPPRLDRRGTIMQQIADLAAAAQTTFVCVAPSGP